MAEATILLAEDDAAIARMYQIKLAAAGYDVTLAADGAAAYRVLSTAPPAVALLDINMPELTGFAVLDKLAAEHKMPQATKVVMLTNASTEADRQAASAHGAGYIVKAEYTPGRLLEYIKTLMGEKRS